MLITEASALSFDAAPRLALIWLESDSACALAARAFASLNFSNGLGCAVVPRSKTGLDVMPLPALRFSPCAATNTAKCWRHTSITAADCMKLLFTAFVCETGHRENYGPR